MSDVSLSVIIPTGGIADDLENCLHSLSAQQTEISFEIIVVGTAMNEKVREVSERYSKVRLIRSDMPLIPSAARNFGVNHAKGEFIGFLDADCVAQPGWVDSSVRSMQDGAIAAGGVVMDSMPWHFIASTDNRLQFADFGPHRPAGVCKHFPACNMVIVQSVFSEIGGFREDIQTGEDVVFAAEVAKHYAERMRFNPAMIARHRGRTNWRGFFEHQKRFGCARGHQGLHMNNSLRWLGDHPWLAWVVPLRRLGYISLRVLQWNIFDLPRFILQLPVLLIGLMIWTQGFYEGTKQRRLSE